MVIHQYIRMNPDLIFFGSFFQTTEKFLAVSIGIKNEILSMATSKDMIISSRVFYTQWSCHNPQQQLSYVALQMFPLLLKITTYCFGIISCKWRARVVT